MLYGCDVFDSVVLLMCAYKSDVYPLNGKLNDYNKTVLVAMDIKDIVLVAHHVCVAIVLPNVTKIAPLPFCGNVVPSFEWYPRICIHWLLKEQFQFLMGYNPHVLKSIQLCKYTMKFSIMKQIAEIYSDFRNFVHSGYFL